MDVNKSYSKSFLKLRTITGIKLRSSVVSLVVFNYNSNRLFFSDKLEEPTVALGVAGASIAFALQEVIASFAGYLAIMFEVLQYGDRVQLGGIKGDVMDIGVLELMMQGQWVDGVYAGRIMIANSYVLRNLYLIIQNFPFLWDEIPIQYGSIMKKQRNNLKVGVEVAGDLTINLDRNGLSCKRQIPFRRCPNRTNDFINPPNDNWAEYPSLWFGYKDEESQNQNCLQEY
jgi:hypothetical protein